MKLPRSGKGRLGLEVIELADQERPPMIRIPEYVEQRRLLGGGEPALRRPSGAGVIVLFAPDSFKGTLTSVQVARALADGWLRARPDDEVLLCPLADGGEGTLEAVAAAGGWDVARAPRPRTRSAGRSAPAGWWHGRRDRDRASSRWPRRPACRASRPTSATRSPPPASAPASSWPPRSTQAPARIMLGHRRQRDHRRRAAASLDALGRDRRTSSTSTSSSPAMSPTRCSGRTGAAAVFGPQKGATPDQVAFLDARNAAWADALEAETGRRERDTPGAGAAGGVGFALLAIQDRFRSFALRPGVDLVMEATDFDARLARADLVITGEGRIDAQTAFGKTALGVARRAQAAGTPCIGVGGGVEPEGVEALAAVGAQAVPVWETPVPLEVALAAGAAPARGLRRAPGAWAAGPTRPDPDGRTWSIIRGWT